MRKEPTPQETAIWARLKASRLHGFSFRRQHVVGPFILDFYCPSVRLAVEVDGAWHNRRADYDQERDQYLVSRRIRVLRFTNTQVDTDIGAVLDRIMQAVQQAS